MATDEQNKSVSRLGKISVLTLAIMSVAAVVSLRGLPSVLLIPVSIVGAELATG